MSVNENLLDNLNKQQEDAVLHTEGSLRIIAGAGSGKTKVITHKIAYLITSIGLDPKSILAVTFTNMAAEEMKLRAKKIVGEKIKNAQISTYHSLAVRILRSEISFLEYPNNFEILDVTDQKQILNSVYKLVGVNKQILKMSSIIDYISRCKNAFISPDDAIEKAKTELDKTKAKIYNEYSFRLSNIKSLDFDDLLLYAVKILKKSKNAYEKWSGFFKYILIDEFQDASSIQYELIKLLSKNKNITIVGDPDQTIYSWRGANVNLILDFNKDFAKTKTIKLEENYRSTKTILKAANKLIKHNKKRVNKNLFSAKDYGEKIIYERLHNPDAEARWVVRKIKELQSKKVQLKNMAIFFRLNYLSHNIEKALISENIDYKLFGGIKFFERQEIKDVIAYLKIIAHNDDVALMRMINVPARKIGALTQDKIIMFARSKRITAMEAIINHFNELNITKQAKERLHEFVKIILSHQKATKNNKPSNIVLSLLKKLGYIEMWKSVKELERIRNVKELVLSLQEWEKHNPSKDIAAYLDATMLFTEKSKINRLSTYVSLMTIHAAKGLEFDYVFIIGASEGIFPSSFALDSTGKDAIEEERRLAYVAITRAREQIFIVSSKGYTIDGKYKKTTSRFIREMGIEANEEFDNYSTVDYDMNYSKTNIKWVVGDKLIHKIFGKGIVLKVDNSTIDIKFKKYGIKSLMKNHNSLKKI